MKTIQEAKDYHRRAEWVRWIDTLGHSGWGPIEERSQMRPDLVDSTGFIIEEDRDRIVLAQSVAGSGNADNVLCIPKRCIEQRWRIG